MNVLQRAHRAYSGTGWTHRIALEAIDKPRSARPLNDSILGGVIAWQVLGFLGLSMIGAVLSIIPALRPLVVAAMVSYVWHCVKLASFRHHVLKAGIDTAIREYATNVARQTAEYTMVRHDGRRHRLTGDVRDWYLATCENIAKLPAGEQVLHRREAVRLAVTSTEIAEIGHELGVTDGLTSRPNQDALRAHQRNTRNPEAVRRAKEYFGFITECEIPPTQLMLDGALYVQQHNDVWEQMREMHTHLTDRLDAEARAGAGPTRQEIARARLGEIAGRNQAYTEAGGLPNPVNERNRAIVAAYDDLEQAIKAAYDDVEAVSA